jgi:hypothetical protein
VMFKKSKVLKALRKELDAGNGFCASCQIAGVKNPQTIYEWARKRSLIKRYIEKCKDIGQVNRDHAVEDTFIRRLINGCATETGYIFYLTNRMPEKYKDMRAVVNNSPTFVNKIEGNLLKLIQEMPTDELKRIVAIAKGSS